MPAGCEFICKNFNCNQNNNGFVITANWPMGKIDAIIDELSKSNKPTNRDLLSKLVEFKNEGRKYACITYPNTCGIETFAYRIQLWSPEAKCIWKYDVELNGKSIQEAIIEANLPTKCPKTDGPLLTFMEVTKEGINCPYCGEKLIQSRWFTNEDN